MISEFDGYMEYYDFHGIMVLCSLVPRPPIFVSAPKCRDSVLGAS